MRPSLSAAAPWFAAAAFAALAATSAACRDAPSGGAVPSATFPSRSESDAVQNPLTPAPLRMRTWGPAVAASSDDLLVLLHGYGADENDLVPLFPPLWGERPGWSLQAPLEMAPGMRAWFPLFVEGNRRSADPDAIRDAVAAIAATLEPARTTPDGSTRRIVVAGFSQGGALAVALAMAHPTLVDAVVVLSGKWPYTLPPAATLASTPFFVVHGRADDVIPIADARDLVERLRAAGATVEWLEHPAGHSTHPSLVGPVRAWLASPPTSP